MIAWVDVETTGLDPRGNDLLEVGIVLTDDRLNELARMAVLIQPSPGRELMIGDEVKAMHEDNGLWDECRSSGRELEAAQYELTRWCVERFDRDNRPVMGGSSVHFDRAWLRAKMPLLEALFHYRNIDVSTLKELNRRFAFAQKWEGDRDLHRSLPDLEDSIAQCRHYLEAITRKEPK